MEEHNGRRLRKREKISTMYYPSGQEIIYLRALQGHSGRNPIDPTLQDNVLIPDTFFEYIYHIVCAINSHSITKSGLIAVGQHSSRDRHTVFFTAVNPMNKEHKDPYEIELNAPRLAMYKQKKSGKDIKTRCIGSDFQLAQQKGFKFYQTSSNAIIFYNTLQAYCILKAIVVKVYASLRPPPKISFEDNWMKEFDSEVAGGSEDSQQIQPKSKTQLSRTVRLVSEPPSGLLTQEIRKDVYKLKNGETCEWTTIQLELCASVYCTCR